ncbi:MAG: DUF421 domain-containing protein [Myxococcota bacterium]|nr:DUF421 domain-containing protein [Myxococcota bacterium]
MWFESWSSVLRVVISTGLGYVGLVLLLRVSGKRTLTKLNAFDLVVTIALGSTLATLALSKQTPIVDGVTAFAMLIGLQYVIAFASVRSRPLARLVKSQPVLVFYRGQFLAAVLRRERLTESEVRAKVRERGFGSIDEVDAVILETAGDISVIERLAAAGSLSRDVDVAALPSRS